MRKDEVIKSILEEMDIPSAYDHFEDDTGEVVTPAAVPYAIYRRTAQRNFGADGKAYYRPKAVEVEVYAATPDEMADIMDKLESKLDEQEMYYGIVTDTAYIPEERIYGTLYDV